MPDTFNLDPNTVDRWAKSVQEGSRNLQEAITHAERMGTTFRHLEELQRQINEDAKQQSVALGDVAKGFTNVRKEVESLKTVIESVSFNALVKSFHDMATGLDKATIKAKDFRDALREIERYKNRIAQYSHQSGGDPVWGAKQIGSASMVQSQIRAMSQARSGGKSSNWANVTLVQENEQYKIAGASVRLLTSSFQQKNEVLKKQLGLSEAETKEDKEQVKTVKQKAREEDEVNKKKKEGLSHLEKEGRALKNMLGVPPTLAGNIAKTLSLVGIGTGIYEWMKKLIGAYDELRLIEGASTQVAAMFQTMKADTGISATNIGKASSGIWEMRRTFLMSAKQASEFYVNMARTGMEMKDLSELDRYMYGVEQLRGVTAKEQYDFIKKMKTEYNLSAQGASQLHMQLMNAAELLPDMSMGELVEDITEINDSVKIFNVSLLDTLSTYNSLLSKSNLWADSLRKAPRSVQKEFVRDLTAMPMELSMGWKAALGKGKSASERVMEFTMLPKKGAGYQEEIFARIAGFLQKHIRQSMSTEEKFVQTSLVLKNFFKGSDLQTILAEAFAGGDLDEKKLREAMLNREKERKKEEKKEAGFAANWKRFQEELITTAAGVKKAFMPLSEIINEKTMQALATAVGKHKAEIDKFLDSLPDFAAKLGDVVDSLWKFGKWLSQAFDLGADEYKDLEYTEAGRLTEQQRRSREAFGLEQKAGAGDISLFSADKPHSAKYSAEMRGYLQKVRSYAKTGSGENAPPPLEPGEVTDIIEDAISPSRLAQIRSLPTLEDAFKKADIDDIVDKAYGKDIESAARASAGEGRGPVYEQRVAEQREMQKKHLLQRAQESIQEALQSRAVYERAGESEFSKTDPVGKVLEEFGLRGASIEVQSRMLAQKALSNPTVLRQLMQLTAQNATAEQIVNEVINLLGMRAQQEENSSNVTAGIPQAQRKTVVGAKEPKTRPRVPRRGN